MKMKIFNGNSADMLQEEIDEFLHFKKLVLALQSESQDAHGGWNLKITIFFEDLH